MKRALFRLTALILLGFAAVPGWAQAPAPPGTAAS